MTGPSPGSAMRLQTSLITVYTYCRILCMEDTYREASRFSDHCSGTLEVQVKWTTFHGNGKTLESRLGR